MAWRLAYSLETLRNEVNARWPNRNKASDGTIGDVSHAASSSDHNPNASGVVCAFDITHDPVNGPDIEHLGQYWAAHPHPDAKYVIFNGKIASRAYNWTVRPYRGDPHTNHIHVSVGVGSDGRSLQPYDDRTPAWLTAAPAPTPPLSPEDDMPLSEDDLNKIRLVATAAARDVVRQTWGVPADTQDGALQMTILGRISGTTSDAVIAKLPPK